MKRLLLAFAAGVLAEWCWLAYTGHLDRPWPVDPDGVPKARKVN